MISSGRVTQQDIANRAGVHITTVSLALRDSRRLPPATRERIQTMAAEMGYCPDPMLSALTVYRERLKRTRHQGVIAWMCPVVKKGQVSPNNLEYRKGAEARCAEIGYELEDFSLGRLGKSRLASILRVRNIQGLLIPPQSFNRSHINFEWDSFSAVCFGFSLARPKLHLITNAQYRSACMAVRALRAHGYRRIGFVTTHSTDERTDRNFSSGFWSEQRRFKPEERIRMLTLEGNTQNELADFEKWYHECLPEVILSHHAPVLQFMKKLEIDLNECGYASLDLVTPDGSIAGIYQNYPLLGRAAVNYLVDMIHGNQRGVPAQRFQILIEGSWVEGETLRNKVVGPVQI
ncbi:MAG: LacI family DNA-binding transcriptional regulator [Chthoniobacterales bacterium]